MMKSNAMDKKPKPKPIERKSGKIANGILRKQSLLNNNNIVKNLNDKPKKGTPVAKRRAAPPESAVPPLPQGCTPLMYACQQADEKLVAEILKKEVSRAADAPSPTARAPQGHSLFHSPFKRYFCCIMRPTNYKLHGETELVGFMYFG